jgi:hypothetical protein
MRLTLVYAALAALLCGCGATTQAAPGPTQQPSAQAMSGSPSATVAAGSPAPAPSPTPPPGVNPRLGITGAQTARLLNADGSAQGATDVFQSATDRKIMAVISLANLPAGTKISYVRYLDGKYVDSRSAVLAKRSKYMYFDFTVLPGKTFTPGHYRLRLYVNEAAAWETVYQVA